MSKILIATRKENTNSSMNERIKKALDCEFVPVNAYNLFKAYQENEVELVVLYLSGLSEDEEREANNFLANSKSIPVILAGSSGVLSRYHEKCAAIIMGYIVTPVSLSVYITEINNALKKVSELSFINAKTTGLTELPDVKNFAPRNILVIDDDIVMLRTINNWLKEFFKVSLSRSCDEAFIYFENNVPDLILLDYDMPVCDGIETLERIRMVEKLKNVPVFFLTGVDDSNFVKKALYLKPQGYILKSNGADYLLSKIQQYL